MGTKSEQPEVSKRVTTADGKLLVLWSDGDITHGSRVVGRAAGRQRLWLGDMELFHSLFLRDWLRAAAKSSTPDEARQLVLNRARRDAADATEWWRKFCAANGIAVSS